MVFRRYWLWLFWWAIMGAVYPVSGYAQTADTSHVVSATVDTAAPVHVLPSKDSVRAAVTKPNRIQRDSTLRTIHRHIDTAVRETVALLPDSVRNDTARDTSDRIAAAPLPLTLTKRPTPPPITRVGIPKVPVSRDTLFYVVICMVLWMGILKSGYGKYYNDLFTVFFRSSLRQHQIREQLLQAKLPSLMYNLFFVGSAGTFLYLLASEHSFKFVDNGWKLWVLSVGCVAMLYAAKFVGLKLSGWIFGMSGAVDTYIFIVFLVNKILGVALIPMVILLAFAKEPLQSTGATLGIMVIVGLVIYRFVRSYRPVWEEVQMSRFHFFLYLCAFEIAPLLLIYKTMLKLL